AHQPNRRLRLAAEPQTGRREVSALTDARKTLAYDFFRILRAPLGNESPPAQPETMPDIQTRELVMLIKRLASSLKAVKPDSCVVREAQDWLRDRKLVSITDVLR
ncbi:hypothetical protein WCV24_21255, partial [Escherichia coli]